MYNTVCLCGSTKFLDKFTEANIELTKRGLVVVSISMCLPRNEDGSQTEKALKEILDLVHLNKILVCETVFVISDYIGFSTAREIIWANMHNKPIIQRNNKHNWDQEAHCIKSGSWYPGIVADAQAVLRK